ncbi:YcnI family protein [Sphingomonas bacterium]|uniref:YcnI family protein n=1 Tax=Sphingomonas bacterium TaxID=1895847 RepID=UPI0015770D95|nr:YcnI family protein [Sphingomonas bacterium]
MTVRLALRGVAALSLAAATAAHAHIVFAEPSAASGSYYAGFLRVSHGCAGSPTVSIRVEIPAAVASARPQPKPGWTLTVEKAPLATPIPSESGGTVHDRVTAITWTGRLDADQFDQFGIMLKLPDASATLYFPTVQRCESGSNEWNMIPAAGQPWHSVKSPAPVLNVTTGTPSIMHGMKM